MDKLKNLPKMKKFLSFFNNRENIEDECESENEEEKFPTRGVNSEEKLNKLNNSLKKKRIYTTMSTYRENAKNIKERDEKISDTLEKSHKMKKESENLIMNVKKLKKKMGIKDEDIKENNLVEKKSMIGQKKKNSDSFIEFNNKTNSNCQTEIYVNNKNKSSIDHYEQDKFDYNFKSKNKKEIDEKKINKISEINEKCISNICGCFYSVEIKIGNKPK